MRKTLTTILILFSFICGLLITNSCRKYRDDEFISLKTPFARIASHKWHVKYFGVDYQDSTNHLYGSYPTKMGGRSFGFTANINSYQNKIYFLTTGPSLPDGNWNFGNGQSVGGNSSIQITTGGSPIKVLNNSNWTVLKLTDSDFHISTTYNNKNYEIYFTKY